MPTDVTPDDAETIRDWETLQVNEGDRTERLRVAGGWLYRTVIAGQTCPGVSLVFVPAGEADD